MKAYSLFFCYFIISYLYQISKVSFITQMDIRQTPTICSQPNVILGFKFKIQIQNMFIINHSI